MTKETDILKAELERLFELEELMDVSKNLLGFEPQAVGGTAAKASFAGALASRCVEEDAVEALCDALCAMRPDVSEKILDIRASGLLTGDELAPGCAFADFRELGPLGEGRLAFSYVGERDGKQHRIKILRREAARDKRGLYRFLTTARLSARVDHPGLARQLEVGSSGDRFYVAHEHVRGTPLSARLGRAGPLHLTEARELLVAILLALQALHEKRIAHGDLRLENVIVLDAPSVPSRAILVDVGSDRLRMRPRISNGRKELFSTVGSPSSVSPEQIRGVLGDARSDLYSFGTLLYHVLTGRPPFVGKTALECAFGHLSETPAPPSHYAPSGNVSRELDELTLRLLAKEASERPPNVGFVLEAIENLGGGGSAERASITREAVGTLLEKLTRNANDDEAAIALESAVAGGDHAGFVAEALLELTRQELDDAAKIRLLFRAGRIAASRPDTRDRAEAVYLKLLELAPNDRAAESALMEVRRRLGKLEEVVEGLLARAERAESRSERSGCFAEIGRIYLNERSDREQALVAFTQAYCESPSDMSLLAEIERLAGKSAQAWHDVLQSSSQAAVDPDIGEEDRLRLLRTTARLWLERAQRPDLSLSSYQAVLEHEPSDPIALDGLSEIYRKTEAWSELGMVLERRADSAAPVNARDLRAEAAEILELKLGDTRAARAIYEEILAADPGHAKAGAALAKLYEREADIPALLGLLEKTAEAQRGEERSKTLNRIAEIVERELHDDVDTERRFESVREADPSSLAALRGLARIYEKAHRFKELLQNLARQVELSTTPRQKLDLFEKTAQIWDKEFLDHERAADALTSVLRIDPSRESASTELRRHLRALARWEELISLIDTESQRLQEPERRVSLLLEKANLLEEAVKAPDRSLAAYEKVLELVPGQAEAMEAVARLRESTGDADAALHAIEALAEKAVGAELKAEQWVRAAKLLEGRGNRDGAIERYKRALEENPRDQTAASALREALILRGDIATAVQFIERELEHTDGNLKKASLLSRLSLLYRENLHDDRRAEDYARRAIDLDPSHFEAQQLLADVAFEGGRFLEAIRYYEGIASRTERQKNSGRVLMRYVDALARTGSTEKALAVLDTLLAAEPDDVEVLVRAADVSFEHGAAERAVELSTRLLDRFGTQLDKGVRRRALYQKGEALRRSGNLEACVLPLEEATNLDPKEPKPWLALAFAYEAQARFADVVEVKTRQLEFTSGEDRIQLLLEIGDIASSKLGDRAQAAKSLVSALDDHPDDRRVLTKLMQLYSDDEDWNKLVDIVLRLAEFVDDPTQKVKYLHSAAIVTARQIGDAARALEIYDRVLELEPGFERAIAEVIELERAGGNHTSVERLLKRKLELAGAGDDQKTMVQTFDELGELYQQQLLWIDQAVDAFEAAHTLDPENRARTERLARLYATDPAKYQEKAIEAELSSLRHDPYRTESYRALRRLFTETQQADAAFCLCQALSVLKLAEPDEERFYRRMRSETAAHAINAITDDDWLTHVMHPGADAFLTSVFALIETSVTAKRGQSLSELGYDARFQLNLAEYRAPVCQSLYYAAGVLGIPLPPTYANPNDPGGVSFLFAHDPSLVLGVAALQPDVPLQPAAFIAARNLTYLRPGMYLRQLLASGTALKAWLFAAIKLTAPGFPVTPELEGAVNEAFAALDAGIQGPVRDHLTRVVSKLLTAGTALDLKRWVAAVDLTADRAGLIASQDLELAVQLIQASDDDASSLSVEERVRELVVYSVTPDYFQVRRRLGIALDS